MDAIPNEQHDALITLHGSLVLVTPVTDAASKWGNRHVLDDAQWLGRALAVEHRCAAALFRGMMDDGLRLECVR